MASSFENVIGTEHVSRQLELKGHTYWILSEPRDSGWQAWVVELLDTSNQEFESVGIEASGNTRGEADGAAERKLRRLLGAPPD